MEITEIRIKLMESSEDRLRAFCSITIDSCFVVRDLKIIDGTNGPFVAMPSRKLSGHCKRCHHKNHLRASYCNHCGAKVQSDQDGGYDSPQKLYADVAHPINSECRELIQNAVIQGFEAELQRSREPGYRSRYDDDFEYEAGRSEKPSAKSKASPVESSGSATDDQAGSQTKAGDTAVIDAPSASVPPPKSAGNEQHEKASADEDDGFGAGVF